MIQTTPHPVDPEAGAIINSRLPEISADLSKLEDFDPATLVMKVSGFGEVPANFSPETDKFSWQVNRRLRQPHLPGLRHLERHRRQSRRKPRSAGPSKSTANPPTSPTASSNSSDFQLFQSFSTFHYSTMFSSLSDSLDKTFRNLRGVGRISEKNISDALREIRIALLEADVEFSVAKDFIARVKEKSMGEDVLKSIKPGEQIVKIFHDELAALLGGDQAPLDLNPPARILICGLNGAGKTTTSAKLANRLKKEGRRPLLIACDLYRPAAIDQLATLAKQVDVPCYTPDAGETDVVKVAKDALVWAEQQRGTVLIFDTAGRQEIDERLIAELKRLHAFVQAEGNPARRRLRHRPAGGVRRQTLRRRRRHHRHHPHQARRRRPRRRGALDARRHRQADQIRRRGRETRPAHSSSTRTAWPTASSAWATSSAWSSRSPAR